jgi:hypothetical protein
MPAAAAAAGPNRGTEPASNVLHLPADILLRCLEPLNHLDLIAASAVSREWRQVASSDQLWQAHYLVSSPIGRAGSEVHGWPVPVAAATATDHFGRRKTLVRFASANDTLPMRRRA